MISNELGGRYYRLGLRGEYVFGKMLLREFRFVGWEIVSQAFFATSRSAEDWFFPSDWFICEFFQDSNIICGTKMVCSVYEVEKFQKYRERDRIF